MGEIAEMMLDGTLCEGCGVYLEGDGEGFPRYCSRDCAQGRGFECEPIPRNPKRSSFKEIRVAKPFPCPACQKRFRSDAAMQQHNRDKHGQPT